LLLQLFLEEERERELERLYENGIADTLNRTDVTIDGGDGGNQPEIEATAVTKHTTETLMAGERIMEAIDLAESERTLFQEYEVERARMSPDDVLRLQPPPKNPVLAAYDLEPEAYVLRVVERVQNTALQDALLVLPFGKVVSLMEYLNIWAQRVSLAALAAYILH
jgi:U3 small nucleolar RNA-associated protein 12